MTEEVLVSVIMTLCSGVTPSSNSGLTLNAIKESKIDCYEKLTNCAVDYKKGILTAKEFSQKCLKK